MIECANCHVLTNEVGEWECCKRIVCADCFSDHNCNHYIYKLKDFKEYRKKLEIIFTTEGRLDTDELFDYMDDLIKRVIEEDHQEFVNGLNSGFGC